MWTATPAFVGQIEGLMMINRMKAASVDVVEVASPRLTQQWRGCKVHGETAAAIPQGVSVRVSGEGHDNPLVALSRADSHSFAARSISCPSPILAARLAVGLPSRQKYTSLFPLLLGSTRAPFRLVPSIEAPPAVSSPHVYPELLFVRRGPSPPPPSGYRL
ncbi:hypothetical protein NL676_007198 [Syzygium grande]|nr:hypothetical protein NL676_007198 [Syzygium grande]